MTTKQINNYNKKDTLIVISSYPEKGKLYAAKQDAVASFAKNRILALQKANPQKRLVIITNYQTTPQVYQENNILVCRVFQRNNPTSLLNILKVIQQLNKSTSILLEFEFATFGDTLTTSLFPLILALLKLSGKNITTELHQVLLNLEAINGHLGHTNQSKSIKYLNIGLRLFYKTLGLLSHDVIVLENHLKNNLGKIISDKKIQVIPHGVDTRTKVISKISARKKLGINQNDFIVLNFGFVTWYKGTDLLVNTFSNQKLKNTKLIIAGGPSFTQKNKDHYQRFYKKVESKIKKTKNITLTGFVPEEQLNLYFCASDLVVFPYRTFMSSSGPLSLAISHKRPFLISRKIKAYLQTPDFKSALEQEKMLQKDIILPLNPKDFSKTIKLLRTNTSKLTQLKKLSLHLRKTRSFDTLAYDQLTILDNDQRSLTLKPAILLN